MRYSIRQYQHIYKSPRILSAKHMKCLIYSVWQHNKALSTTIHAKSFTLTIQNKNKKSLFSKNHTMN